MNRKPQKLEMTDDQEQVISALLGATEAVACAVDQETITAVQIDCLFSILIKQLKSTFN